MKGGGGFRVLHLATVPSISELFVRLHLFFFLIFKATVNQSVDISFGLNLP